MRTIHKFSVDVSHPMSTTFRIGDKSYTLRVDPRAPSRSCDEPAPCDPCPDDHCDDSAEVRRALDGIAIDGSRIRIRSVPLHAGAAEVRAVELTCECAAAIRFNHCGRRELVVYVGDGTWTVDCPHVKLRPGDVLRSRHRHAHELRAPANGGRLLIVMRPFAAQEFLHELAHCPERQRVDNDRLAKRYGLRFLRCQPS